MHLKSLVLKGFKSFADRSVMSFEPGVTAIVGPNGSGKSNVSDAVLWVLGERNARNLRGQSMEDVIFSGSSARKPLGMAEVSLVLDNSDGTLPVDFTEVSLTRRMYRDGESEYLINGTLARRMDVLDILHDSGLGTGTHSIIGQGQLSSILQSKPEDRRALIEEAAGVLKHKQRKEKSERKLALMDTHLTRVQDIVNEVQRQVKPLERKAKRAIEHRDASEKLAAFDLQLAVDDLHKLQQRWDAVVKSESDAEKLAADIHSRIEEKERASRQLQDQLQEFTAGAGDLSRQHRRAQAALDKIDSDILLFHEKKRATMAYLAEMRISLENDVRAAQAAQAQRCVTEQSAVSAREADREARLAMEKASAAAVSTRSAQSELQRTIDGLSHARRDALSGLEEARSLLARTQEILSSNRTQSQMIDIQVQDLEERLLRARSDSDAANAQEAQASAALAQAQEDEAKLRTQAGNALQARDRARAASDHAREERAAAGARLKSLEELQRARQAKNPLRIFGVKRASELQIKADSLLAKISAPEHLEPVVSQLLGEDVNAILVQDLDSALSIARDLASSEEPGVITMMPVGGSARCTATAPSNRLIDCIAFEEDARSAIEALLGGVSLFGDFSQAADFAKRNAGVTCASEDGFVIWGDGRITCYRRRADEATELAGFRELEGARADLARAESAFDKAKAEAEACEASLRAVQSKSLEVSQKVAQLKGQVQVAQRDRQRAASALQQLMAERGKLDERRRAADAAVAKSQPDVAAYEARVQALSHEIDSLKGELDARRGELSPIRAAADKAAADLADAKLTRATSAERLAYAERMLEACDRDIRRAQDQADRARAGIARKEAGLARIDPVVLLLTQLTVHAKAQVDRLERQSASSQSRSDALHSAINEAREGIRAAYESYDSQAQRLADIRVEKGRIEMQVESAIATIERDCATPLDRALEIPEPEDRQALEEQAGKLRRRIAGMGAINPDAAQEYEALKERYDYLSSQLEDMMAARRALNKITRVIDRRMRDDFARTFDQVNANFQEVFAKLFPEGKGELSLVDPEDLENTGVEVSAQPPGKRILKMSLMSGGEKSLTALALLFAVYKTRATPFYILDEVEAALDDTNLRRLVAYLNTLRETSQFIMITHQRRTMEMADVLYGISMHADGVTKVMSQRLDKALQYAEG